MWPSVALPKEPRKFAFCFEKTGRTRFGGLRLFQSFCKWLALRRFLQHILPKRPASLAATRTRRRLEGAFYDKVISAPREAASLGYVVVARMYRSLKRRRVAARDREFAAGGEAAAFTYTPFAWKPAHRFSAVRRANCAK